MAHKRRMVGEAGTQEILALADKGLSPREIGEQLVWHPATVRAALAKAGRPRQPPPVGEAEKARAIAELGASAYAGGGQGKLLSPAQRAVVRALAAKGLGVHDIARVLARSAGPIRAVLKDSYNPRGRVVSDQDAAAMAELLAGGLSAPQVAERTGWHPATVRAVRSRAAPKCWCPGPGRLSAAERERIRVGIAEGLSCRGIAKAIGRAPSTVSRELNANGGRRAYEAWAAHGRAAAQARRPKVAKLKACPALAAQVGEWLEALWSPQQISQRLRRELAHDPMMRVSHETIYKSLYVQGRGALRKELAQCLRSGRAQRKAQGRLERRSTMPGMVMISERPPEAADRAVPGHWEGDLVMGAGNRSAVGTLVERSTRYVLLMRLADSRAETVDAAMRRAISALPAEMFRTITWDQGREMARHAAFSVDTGVRVYFCDPHSPWQRGTNENTNGLLRQYLPKGTDLSVHSQQDLDRIARSLNSRPRQTLGWLKPSEKLAQLLPTVAVTG